MEPTVEASKLLEALNNSPAMDEKNLPRYEYFTRMAEKMEIETSDKTTSNWMFKKAGRPPA